jgi:hypothetical protein
MLATSTFRLSRARFPFGYQETFRFIVDRVCRKIRGRQSTGL